MAALKKSLEKALPPANDAKPTKAAKAKKAKPADPAQREMLLPIPGKKAPDRGGEAASKGARAAQGRVITWTSDYTTTSAEPAPAMILRQVSFFDLRRVFTEELSDYYGEDPESFEVVEATWNNDDEYAEVVTLTRPHCRRHRPPAVSERCRSHLGGRSGGKAGVYQSNS